MKEGRRGVGFGLGVRGFFFANVFGQACLVAKKNVVKENEGRKKEGLDKGLGDF